MKVLVRNRSDCCILSSPEGQREIPAYIPMKPKIETRSNLTGRRGYVAIVCHTTGDRRAMNCLLRLFSILALMSVLATTVSSAHIYADYPSRPVAEYENRTELGDLAIAVEPLDDAAVLKKYFNLKPGGILPVFLVIKNNSARDTYLFDESAVGLGEAADLKGKNAKKIYAILGSGGLVDLALTKSASHERENMLKKEIRSRTIAPGGWISGFIYVPVNDDVSRGKMHLQVPLTNARTGESHVVNIMF